MYIVGITGGIASGKTSVSRYLQQRGYPVLDCDLLARDALRPGTEEYYAVVDHFGDYFVMEDGEINRRRLGKHVFTLPKERAFLEEKVHAYVLEHLKKNLEELKAAGARLVFIEIPLLFEVQWEYLVDHVWLISCERETQVERIMRRDHLSRVEAESRIDAQMSLTDKIGRAGTIISSENGFAELYLETDRKLKMLVEALESVLDGQQPEI